jgi:hypothetical protein
VWQEIRHTQRSCPINTLPMIITTETCFGTLADDSNFFSRGMLGHIFLIFVHWTQIFPTSCETCNGPTKLKFSTTPHQRANQHVISVSFVLHLKNLKFFLLYIQQINTIWKGCIHIKLCTQNSLHVRPQSRLPWN